MNIPDEVIEQAEDLYWDRKKTHKGLGCAEEAYEHVAEWARREALREAAEAAMGPSLSGILHDGATARDIAEAIHALTEVTDHD